MQNNVVKYVGLSLQEIKTYANLFFESGMFTDMRGAAQALVKIQAGQEIGISPFAAMSGMHIIAGKPVTGAGIIAGAIKASEKYDYKIIEHTNDICTIEFFEILPCGPKETLGVYSYSRQDAEAAQTKNMPKYPRNMLFARAISDGMKFYCPDVFRQTVYTYEEMNTTEDATHEVMEQNVLSITREPYSPTLDMKPDTEHKKDWAKVIRACTKVEQLAALKSGAEAIPLKEWTSDLKQIATEQHALIVAAAEELKKSEVKQLPEGVANTYANNVGHGVIKAGEDVPGEKKLDTSKIAKKEPPVIDFNKKLLVKETFPEQTSADDELSGL